VLSGKRMFADYRHYAEVVVEREERSDVVAIRARK
jgi:hypothetical protein